MEEEEQEQSAVRIFVGGLGEAVTGDDLQRLFASLGTVQSIDTIRTKGRSFAYLDFIPSPTDPKSLTKLFSKYNGCAWKGGRLRLEKAKENYLARLKKEWEEEALVNSIQSPSDDDDVPAQNNELEENPNARRASNIPDTKQLRVFFPRLRKVKSIPFSGSGKHKYSFQNIKVPPMPVHFCDCEEHCSPFVKERGKVPSHGTAEIGGINDEEINIMNAVMNKLFEKEKVSNTKDLEKGQDSFKSPDALPLNECEVDSATDDDDDGLIINIETKKSKAALSGSHELERIMENPESWSNKTRIAKEEPKESMLQVQKRSDDSQNKVKKRKPLPELESESNGCVSTTPGSKSNTKTLPDELGSGAHPAKVSWIQKSSWKELLGQGGSAAFSASLILPKPDSGIDQQRTDDPSTPSSASDETENSESDDEYPGSEPTNTQVIQESAEPQPTNKRVIKELAKAQPTDKGVINEPAEVQPINKGVMNEPTEAHPTHKQVTNELAETQHNVAPNNTGRGASWLRKQSWTQLVSPSNNSFSISQILPDITFPEPIFKEPVVDPANSDDCKHGGVNMDTTNEAFNGEIIPEKSQHTDASDTAAPVVEQKTETSPGDDDTSTADIEIGETCSFMRSAASLKEWAKAKAALSGSLKRKRGEK